MNTSPITSWEGAEAYFTFADKPGILIFIFCLAMAATIVAVYLTARHEKISYNKPTSDLPHIME